MKHPDLAEGLELVGLSPTAEQVTALAHFSALLADRGVGLGLISEADAPRIDLRHILDCARAAHHPVGPGRVADLGSGGGLPGIVVAVLRPDLDVLLVERRVRRAAFLEWAVEQLSLRNATVLAGGITEVEDPGLHACYARALSALPEAWSLARPRLRPGGSLVYFAGLTAQIPSASVLPGAVDVEVVQAPAVVAGAGPLVIIRA